MAVDKPCSIVALFDPETSVDRIFPDLAKKVFSHPDSVLFATALEVAHRQAPTDPLARGKIALEFIKANGGTFGRDSVPLTADGKAQHKGQPFGELTPVVFPGQPPLERTLDFVNGKWDGKTWVVPPGSQILVILLPGAGANYSHAGSTLEIGSIFSKVNAIATADPSAKKFHQELRRQIADNHVVVAVSAMEMPGTLVGPDLRQFSRKGSLALWLAENIRARRQAAGNLPTVVLARSAFAGIVPQVAKENPGLLDGMVLAGVTHPHPRLGMDSSYFAALYEAAMGLEGEVVSNQAGYQLVNKAMSETDWYSGADPFSGVATQVMFGAEDRQSSADVRDYFRKATPNFFEIAGAKHNPFINQAGTKDVALYSYGLIYAFLRSLSASPGGRP